MLIILVGRKIIDDFFFFPHEFFGRETISKVSVVNMQLFYNIKTLEIIKQYMRRVQIKCLQRKLNSIFGKWI